jgi:REP element-mobilizing transposase RayT
LRADFVASAGVERARGYGRKMPRPPREVDPQGIYHLTARGNNRRAVYLDDADREAFFRLLTTIVDRHGWLCVAYCLMTNHYHLLVWLQNGELSEGMKTLNCGHARRFNKRYGCEGHVFRNRFHAEPVMRESHLLGAARYIVLNPVRAGSAPARSSGAGARTPRRPDSSRRRPSSPPPLCSRSSTAGRRSRGASTASSSTTRFGPCPTQRFRRCQTP